MFVLENDTEILSKSIIFLQCSGVCDTKVMGSIPRECMNWSKRECNANRFG